MKRFSHFFWAIFVASQVHAQEAPRLVLQITVDQLRADLLTRFAAGFGEDGFAYLLRNGVVFENAHHAHANTETIVGHTTLATGADPARHGMVGNLWFDRLSGQTVYNVQDAEFPLLNAAGISQEDEIDPTQRAATTDGRSPRNIITSTISDEIRSRFGPDSKVFGVSVKDRGAISMAGHSGQAYWFSKSEGRFVTSSYYRDAYPDWLPKWHETGIVDSFGLGSWTLRDAPETYLFGDRDDQPWETDFPGFGRVFPHSYGIVESKYYTTLLTLSPAGDVLTSEFAKEVISQEGLGQDDVPDYLSVSFSSTDYVGHIFGPSSLEAEDNLRRLDDTLAGLLSYVDQTVGLENTLIVLSADHGGPDNPGYLKTIGVAGGIFDFKALDIHSGFARLRDEFGASQNLIETYAHPYVYLDHTLISEAGHDIDIVQQRVSEELERLPGIARAIPEQALRNGAFAPGHINEAVLANYHADRSGDIYIVFEPNWFISDFDGLVVASTHGSPWVYDTHVPVVFAGPGISAKRVWRKVHTRDVAGTIALYLGAGLPSGSDGGTLPEVLPD